DGVRQPVALRPPRHLEHGQAARAVARLHARLGRAVPAGADGRAAQKARRAGAVVREQGRGGIKLATDGSPDGALATSGTAGPAFRFAQCGATRICASAITLPHSALSSAMKRAASAAVPGIVSSRSAANFSPSSPNAAFTPRLILSTIVAGVPGGATST